MSCEVVCRTCEAEYDARHGGCPACAYESSQYPETVDLSEPLVSFDGESPFSYHVCLVHAVCMLNADLLRKITSGEPLRFDCPYHNPFYGSFLIALRKRANSDFKGYTPKPIRDGRFVHNIIVICLRRMVSREELGSFMDLAVLWRDQPADPVLTAHIKVAIIDGISKNMTFTPGCPGCQKEKDSA